MVLASCQESNNLIQLFDVTSGIEGAVALDGYIDIFSCTPGELIFSGIDGHSYAAIEMINNRCVGQDYSVCSANSFSNVISERGFLVTGDQVLSQDAVSQYGPEMSILSPVAGTAFSRTGTISYKATDANDLGKPNERERYGLPQKPVTLYYSDKIAERESETASVPREYKILIAGDQPAEGSYAWSITDLIPGVFYRIIADVFDATGTLGEAVSDLFTVDFDAPVFIVSADPPATQGKDVTIIVDASENLASPPKVIVTQAGGAAVPLSMSGEGSRYEGTYSIVKGYDGVATITVSGADAAGNTSATIVSGGTFAVGLNPPPAPSVSSPRTDAVVGTSTIAVSGTLRPDTTAVVVVNGVDTYTASSSPDGAFSVASIRLEQTANRGANIVSVAARDQTGLSSEAVPIRIKYNVAPQVAVALPEEKASVSASALLSASAEDGNADPLAFTYQIISAQAFDAAEAATSTKNEWITVGNALPSPSFSWDSTEVEDGQYFLRIVADDGYAKAYSTPILFSIRNTLSFFRFEDGRKTMTNSSTATVVGRAITPETVSPRPTVQTVEYSLDGGKKWKPVPISSGTGTSQASFSLALSGLIEGTQKILWRVKDSRNFYGRASHPIVVDKVAPAKPIVNAPANNAFVTDKNDANTLKEDLQISVSGTAEPQSTVILEAGDAAPLQEKARADGSFIFRSVDILGRGAAVLTLTARDEAGNESVPAAVNIVYDNPPTVLLLSPKPFRGLSGKARVSWSIRDADGDPIRHVALSYRRGQGVFAPLLVAAAETSFVFDVSRFPEATDYQLRLEASDGMATGTDAVGFSVDATPPSLDSFTLDAPVLGKGDTLLASGSARDSLSGVEYVEYAIAQGEPESFFTALLTSGFLRESAAFSIKHPTELSDGAYTVYARAVDAAGNVSLLRSQTVIVDTMPPHIGSFDIVAQGIRIPPNEQGVIALYKGMEALFEVSLEGDTARASLSVGSTSVPLKKDIVSGLWQATVRSGEASSTPLSVSAEDERGNRLSAAPLGALIAVEYGSVATLLPEGGAKPLQGAEMEVLILSEGTGSIVPFSGAETAVSGADGTYALALPTGTYKLVPRLSGYRGQAQELMLERPGLVGASFYMKKSSGVWGFIQRAFDKLFSQ